MERKSFSASSFTIKDEGRGEVRARLATIGQVDRDSDVFLPGSVPKGSRVRISSFGHDAVRENVAPVGTGEVFEQDGAIIMSGRLFMNTSRGAETFQTLLGLGDLAEWSIGYPRDSVTLAPMTPEWRRRGAKNLIASFEPLEASPVLRGAQVGTATLQVKQDSGGVDLAAAQSLVSLKAIMAEGELSHADVAGAMEVSVDALRAILKGERPLPNLPTLKVVVEPLEAKQKTTTADYRRHRVEFEREFGPTEARVSPDERRAAENLVRWAAARSGLRLAPVVKFYAPSDTSPPWRGLYDPRTRVVWLRKGLGRSDLLKASFHELRHFARHVQGLDWRDETAVATETDRLLNTFTLERSPAWQNRSRMDLFEKLSTS